MGPWVAGSLIGNRIKQGRVALEIGGQEGTPPEVAIIENDNAGGIVRLLRLKQL
jgi:hypothetical protein